MVLLSLMISFLLIVVVPAQAQGEPVIKSFSDQHGGG